MRGYVCVDISFSYINRFHTYTYIERVSEEERKRGRERGKGANK
jgi:hypothetical protein